ncbi:GTP cyclohydrolase II [Anaeromyxobacter sp. Red801]|uniref:GTP cyclohydrolase II n=1 Tax=Anaeromyxobacter sp. Red801 TaxID=3411632 RepID=UPI003B9FEC29
MTGGGDALAQLVLRDRDHECEGFGPGRVCVRVVAVARLPTRAGPFRIVAFWNNRDAKEHVALVHGDVVGASDVPVRLHSECLTGDVMGSLRCDCRDQLTEGLAAIQREGRGVLLYLRQEGRGIGLINKIRAYALQEQGLDTVEANLALGFRDDERDYAVAAHMIHGLELRSIRLITNNPEKLRQLTAYRVEVSGRIPHVIPPGEHNRFYLETKARRSGHLIDVDALAPRSEQADPVVVAPAPQDPGAE